MDEGDSESSECHRSPGAWAKQSSGKQHAPKTHYGLVSVRLFLIPFFLLILRIRGQVLLTPPYRQEN